MQEYGSTVAPLNLIGQYLNYAGNHLLYHMATIMKRKVFFPNHRVTKVELLPGGEVMTTTMRKVVVMRKDDPDYYSFQEKEQKVQFRSKCVVFSNGGK